MYNKILRFIKEKAVVIIVITIVLDICLKVNNKFVYSDTELMNKIPILFTVYVTVAVLSPTVLNFLVGILSEKYFGFEIREIFNFESSEINFQMVTPGALFSVIIAFISYMTGLFITLFFLFILLVIVVAFYSEYIWLLITNKKMCENIVIKEIENKKNDKETVLNQLNTVCVFYCNTVENNNRQYREKLLEITEKIIQDLPIREVEEFIIKKTQ